MLVEEIRRIALATVLLITAASTAWAGPDPVEAQRFIRQGVERSVLLINQEGLSRGVVAERVQQELVRNFDMRTIAVYALGSYGAALSADQKERYMAQFTAWAGEVITRLVMTLRDGMASVSPDAMSLVGTTPVAADQILVHTRVRLTGGDSANIDWRLRLKDGRFLILDMMMLGISQLEMLRSQFQSILAQDSRNIERLIADLKHRNAQLATR